jgi:hypothetical protein
LLFSYLFERGHQISKLNRQRGSTDKERNFSCSTTGRGTLVTRLIRTFRCSTIRERRGRPLDRKGEEKQHLIIFLEIDTDQPNAGWLNMEPGITNEFTGRSDRRAFIYVFIYTTFV